MVVWIDKVRVVRALSGLIVTTEWLPGTGLRTALYWAESQTSAKQNKETYTAKI